jgi:hypothetical protein
MKCLVSLTLFLCCLLSKVVAQDNSIRKSIFFNTGQYTLSPKNKGHLNQWLDSLDKSIYYKLVLLGNTDRTGSKALNQRLSKLRAEAAKKYLTTRGFQFSPIVTAAGDKSMAANRTQKEQAKNRRVDIIILPITDSISSLYKKLEKKPQAFCINPTRDTVLVGDNGTIISIKANTFTAPTKGCVTIALKEFYKNSDIILGNLNTVSNNRMLETQGMIYIEAEYEGRTLTPGKPISLLMPNKEQINAVQLFNGEEHANEINWVPTSQPLISYSLNMLAMNGCLGSCLRLLPDSIVYEPVLKQRDTIINEPINRTAVATEPKSNNCHSIWCRMGRFFSNIFSGKKSGEEPKKEQQQQFVQVKKTIVDTIIVERKIPRNPDKIDLPFLFSRSDSFRNILSDTCLVMLKKLKEMNLKRIEEFNVAVRKAVANKVATAENFITYMALISTIGYKNFDAFAIYDKSMLTSIYADEIPNTNIAAKLVFKKRRIALPFNDMGIRYGIMTVPKGEEAWVVALKYYQQQPYLSMQLITIGDKQRIKFNFKQVSIDQMERELQAIDNPW